MKLQHTSRTTRGFTLIEMIGVLAVIAILAALLIPKVFNAINEAKVNTVPVGVGTVKAAAIEHFAKWGALNVIGAPKAAVAANADGTGGSAATSTTPITSYPHNDYDGTVLMIEGFIEKPFAPKVGTGADVVLVATPASGNVDGGAGKYDLDGAGGVAVNDAAGTHVLEAVIQGVPVKDAQDISMRIDGIEMSQPTDPAAADLKGRVIYAASDAGAPVIVRVYITHR